MAQATPFAKAAPGEVIKIVSQVLLFVAINMMIASPSGKVTKISGVLVLSGRIILNRRSAFLAEGCSSAIQSPQLATL